MSLLPRIECYLRAKRIAATRFGREVARDPRLVHDMRRGREPGGRMRRLIEARLAGAVQ